MTKSELITLIASKQPHLPAKDVELAINCLIEVLTSSIATGERIEIRSFGGFTRIPRKARQGRNPKTGAAVNIPNKHAIHFKPGLDMRQRIDNSRHTNPTIRDL